ncbi:MAG: hypothetical protein D6786_03435 [Gammaproteobacteria bacterium]|nr:MAG: hypothetical protein D6786_03435 [Gammaproteobacteria bacterium]
MPPPGSGRAGGRGRGDRTFQWSVVSGQWSVVSGQWSVVSGQWKPIEGLPPVKPFPGPSC